MAGDQPSPGTESNPAQPELNNLPERLPPSLAEKGYRHGRQPDKGEVTVITSQAAWQQIVAHGSSNLNTELGGALLGHAYRHGQDVFVEVLAALPATSQDHGPVHFTFTADSWAQLHQDRNSRYPQLDIVGWFHTHPGLGVFYSGDDVIVHSAAFTLPWHVGLVVDPIRLEACFFGWVNGELAPLAGFYEVAESQAESIVKWQVVRTAVWQEGQAYDYGEQGEAEGAAGRVYAPGNSWPALSPVVGWIGMIAGALSLLLGFFLLVAWVLPLRQEVNHLRSVALTLANEGMESNHAAACPDRRLRILTPAPGQSVAAGASVSVIGTADYPEAVRYRLEVRPSGVDTWTLIRAIRRDTSLGQLATWDTAPHSPARYELRLTAVDGNNVRLANSAMCLIEIELTPQ
jgi:proteasome lid subunit RPN8/RPN11